MANYLRCCRGGVDFFGRTRLVEDLAADDFEQFRATLAATKGPSKMFTPAELRQMIDAADQPSKAFILLGLNGLVARAVAGLLTEPPGPTVGLRVWRETYGRRFGGVGDPRRAKYVSQPPSTAPFTCSALARGG